MEFNTLFFIFIFLTSFIILMNIFKDNKIQNIILLIYSLIFYYFGDHKHFIILLLISLITYLFGRKVKNNKKIYFLYLLLVISILCVYKYFNYLIDAFMLYQKNPDIRYLIMPLGISFYTFTAISYISDIYYEKYEAENNYFNILLFLSFFPTIISGPLIRYDNFKEFIYKKDINYDNIAKGLRRFIIGLSKKVIIANQLNMVTNIVFNDQTKISFLLGWYGILSYALQIYYDFSGYSDMAIGIAKMISYNVPENFNNPYFSKSISEFWRRWHMTLGLWFKDYLFYPLSKMMTNIFKKFNFHHKKINRNLSKTFTLLILWIIEGAWHGPSILFIIFGLYHGTFIILETIFKDKYEIIKKNLNINDNNKLYKAFQILRTFLIITIGMIFFRADSLKQAFIILKALLGVGASFSLTYIRSLDILYLLFYFLLGLIFIIPRIKKIFIYLDDKMGYLYDLIMILLFMISIFLIIGGSYSSFIYFKF